MHTVSANINHVRPIVLAMPGATIFFSLCLARVSGTIAIVFCGLLVVGSGSNAIVFCGLLVVGSGSK